MTSATTGAGIAELVDAVSRCLVPHVPPPGTPIPFLPEHIECLTQTLAAVHSGDLARAEHAIHQLLGRNAGNQ